MSTIKLFNHHFRTPFLFLLLIEFVIFFISTHVGVYLRFDQFAWQPNLEGIPEFPIKAAIYSIVMMCGMIAMGQYQTPSPQGRHYLPGISVRIIISLLLGILGLVVIYYIFPSILIGRGVIGFAVTAAFVSLVVMRLIFYHTVDGRVLRRRVLVFGAGKLAKNILGETTRALAPQSVSYVVHGFIEADGEETVIEEKYLVKPGKDLASYCEAYEIEEIILAIGDRRKTLPVESLLDCKLSNVNVIDFVSFWEREKSMLRLDMLNPSWIIFNEGCEQGGLNQVTCRLFDILISCVILSFMLPILILTAILIYIESGFRGPIFYKQERVGLNGETFELLKFRSMIVNAEKKGEAQWAQQDDVRITRIGRFIRKVRIDELPQILNIFRGDMSLVGPRPERPEFVFELEEKIPFYGTRHRVKPGLAGWAQLKYPYGASEEDAYNKLQYDLYYVKNHSLIMDVLVLLQTVEVIILGKGVR